MYELNEPELGDETRSWVSMKMPYCCACCCACLSCLRLRYCRCPSMHCLVLWPELVLIWLIHYPLSWLVYPLVARAMVKRSLRDILAKFHLPVPVAEPENKFRKLDYDAPTSVDLEELEAFEWTWSEIELFGVRDSSISDQRPRDFNHIGHQRPRGSDHMTCGGGGGGGGSGPLQPSVFHHNFHPITFSWNRNVMANIFPRSRVWETRDHTMHLSSRPGSSSITRVDN